MKRLLALILVAACSGGATSQPSPATPAPSAASPGDPVASPAPANVCDPCSDPSTPVASPDPAQGPAQSGGGVPCSREIAIRCRAPGVDGCDGGKTTVHVCVAKDAKPGPPCAQEIALACPAGQIDACLRTPAVSANHICVLQ